MVPLYASFAACETENLPQYTLPFKPCDRAVGVANTEAVTQQKPFVAHGWCSAPGCCNNESSSPLDKTQLVKCKSKQEFTEYSHKGAVFRGSWATLCCNLD